MFAFVALAALAWTLVGVLFAVPALTSGDPWQRPLLRSLIDWWSWGLLTPAILYCDRLLPFAQRQWFRRLAAHFFLSVVFTVLYLHVHTIMLALLGQGPWQTLGGIWTRRGVFGGSFFWVWPIYWPIAGAVLAMRYYRQYLASELRSERLERLASEARLQALRLQLDPHFLFNALNTISAQTENNPRLAREMIGHLGDLLRSSLENRDRKEVTLEQELAQLEHYIAIQRIRFGDRVAFSMEITAGTRQARVPAFILQPLIENAVRHGISERPEGGTIQLSARRHGDDLILLLADDGVGLPENWQRGSRGMGLAITRERLAGMYADRGRLDLRRRENGGTEVELRLPFSSSATAAEAAP